MYYHGDWLIKDIIPSSCTGLLVSSEGNHTLIITDLASGKQKKFPRKHFNQMKFCCEILANLQKEIGIPYAKNMYINWTAAVLIDEICYINQLLS